MQYIHDFNISVSKYAENGKLNNFPTFSSCLVCKAVGCLREHGFYERNTVLGSKAYRIVIRRYVCCDCGRTVSVLPNFLLPFFQYSLFSIVSCLTEILKEKKEQIPFYRQLSSFYSRRFIRNLGIIVSFFREIDLKEIFPEEEKKKAIKLMELISAFPKTTFSQRYFSQFQKSFMAL